MIDNPASFRDEARFQVVCAVCGVGEGRWQAHHVLHEQECARLGLPLYDTRNALRLCTAGYVMGGCHARHHNKQRKIRVQELTHDNIIFMVEALADYAPDWLERYYDAAETDPRLVAALTR